MLAGIDAILAFPMLLPDWSPTGRLRESYNLLLSILQQGCGLHYLIEMSTTNKSFQDQYIMYVLSKGYYSKHGLFRLLPPCLPYFKGTSATACFETQEIYCEIGIVNYLVKGPISFCVLW